MKFFLLSGMHLPDGYTRQIWRTMKLTFILLTAFFLHVSATTLAQQVTLKKDRITLKQAFTEIRKQTGFVVLYGADEVDVNKTVTLNLDHVALKDAMTKILEDQNLDFTIEDQSIVIKKKETTINEPQSQPRSNAPPVVLTGKVTNELGEPMAGVNIKEKTSALATATDSKGRFILNVSNDKATILFSYIGYETLEITAKDIVIGSVITLKPAPQNLQEVVVNQGYYSRKQELNTGDVSIVTAKEISDQPVTDPILALEGKVPGLYISQTSGMPGAYSTIRVMGQNSILNGSDPLYIIDGVPFSATSPTDPNIGAGPLGSPTVNGYNGYARSGSPGAGISPFNLLDPSNIETIEVLKDADATAIYGSRGANGVVLITTKKGKAGETRVNFNVAQGIGQVTRNMPMMNTQQYVQMRNEANTNGGFAAEPGYDVDLLNWDTTHTTNWQKVLLGNTEHYTNTNLSLSGGNTNTQFIMGGTFSRNTTVFPGDFADNKSSGYINISHHSTDQKFAAQLSVSYLYDNNALPGTDLTSSALQLAPDAPPLTNSDGSLNWGYYQGNPTLVSNPLAYILEPYSALTDNLQTSLNLSYKLLPNLIFSTNLGYNRQNSRQTQLTPGTSVPIENLSSSTRENSGANDLTSYWSIEPQLNFNKKMGKSSLNILFGSSFQSNSVNDASYSAYGYTSDVQLSNPAAASSLTYNYLTSLYRYTAVYGRIGYTWDDKYILNVTARRDGSSRFGPGDQWGNFGSTGVGWIFSKEKFISELSWLSFGKLRASYGVTGNDQIGNYQYLSTYQSHGTSSYQGSTLLYPSGLANPYYSWEHVKKLETGIDLGFLKDRINITASWFRNRDDDQLVGYILPQVTGFYTVTANLPANVQNTGWEFTGTAQNIKTKDFSWTTSFNLTLPQNKLLAFPGIQNSSYANTFVVGQSLFSHLVYHYTGVSPQTGQYTFATQNANGLPSLGDRVVSKPITQTAYGSLSNSFHYKDIQLDVMFYFVKQTGFNYLKYFQFPGAENSNQPTYALNAWQYPGQKANVAQYNSGSNGFTPYGDYLTASDAAISDASFIRLRNVSLSYNLPQFLAKAITFQNLQIYLQGENLLTITGYKGLDPETQGLSLPPLRMFTFGIKGTL